MVCSLLLSLRIGYVYINKKARLQFLRVHIQGGFRGSLIGHDHDQDIDIIYLAQERQKIRTGEVNWT